MTRPGSPGAAGHQFVE